MQSWVKFLLPLTAALYGLPAGAQECVQRPAAPTPHRYVIAVRAYPPVAQSEPELRQAAQKYAEMLQCYVPRNYEVIAIEAADAQAQCNNSSSCDIIYIEQRGLLPSSPSRTVLTFMLISLKLLPSVTRHTNQLGKSVQCPIDQTPSLAWTECRASKIHELRTRFLVSEPPRHWLLRRSR